MKIGRMFLMNKIEEEGIDLGMVYGEMKGKVCWEIIVKEKVGEDGDINVRENEDMEEWDGVIMGKDEVLEKYM